MIPASKFGVKVLDRSAIAMQDLLYADDDVRKYVGSRVVRTRVVQIPLQGHTTPTLYVSLGTSSVVRKPSSCSDLLWSIVITLCFSPGVSGPMGPLEPSEASFFAHLQGILQDEDNQMLKVSRYSNAAQATRFQGFDPTEYLGEDEVDGKAVLKRALVANYIYVDLPSDTLEPA